MHMMQVPTNSAACAVQVAGGVQNNLYLSKNHTLPGDYILPLDFYFL